MQEQITQTKPYKFVIRPEENEKADVITNEYLKKMPCDEIYREDELLETPFLPEF